jgi:hypothetical protein
MVLLYLLPSCALAQELSVEDRACITAAAGKLPTIAALEIKGSPCTREASPRVA